MDLEALFKMPKVDGEFAVTVGSEKIPKAALEEVLRALQIEVGAAGAPDNLSRYEVLRSAVDRLAERARRKLLARELKVKLDRNQVDLWIKDLEARMAKNPSFKVFLLRAGKDAAARKKDAERAVLWTQVQDAVFDQVLDESEPLARDYYDRNKAQYTERAGVETWRILLKAPRGMVQRDRDIVRTRAEKIHARAVAKPASFESLARDNSDGGKGPHGGFIGWVAKGSLVKAIEDQIFAAKPNTILPLYEAPVGFYIYKVGRSRKERVKPFESVKEDILRKVFSAKVVKQVSAHMKRLQDKYPTEAAIPELAALQKKEQARIDAIRARIEAMEKKKKQAQP